MPARRMGAAAACASRSLPCPAPPHPSFPPDRAGHGRRPASRACAASAGPSRQPIASVPRAAAPARVPLWVWPSCAFCARLGPPVCVRLCDRGPKPSVEVVAGRRAGGVRGGGGVGNVSCGRSDEPCGCASARAGAGCAKPPRQAPSPFGGPVFPRNRDFRRVTAPNAAVRGRCATPFQNLVSLSDSELSRGLSPSLAVGTPGFAISGMRAHSPSGLVGRARFLAEKLRGSACPHRPYMQTIRFAVTHS